MAGVWHQQEFGIATVQRKADPLRDVTELLLAAQAEATTPAAPASIDGNGVSFLEPCRSRPQALNVPRVLVTQGARQNYPARHLQEVQISMADSRTRHSHQHLVAFDFRYGNILQLQGLPCLN